MAPYWEEKSAHTSQMTYFASVHIGQVMCVIKIQCLHVEADKNMGGHLCDEVSWKSVTEWVWTKWSCSALLSVERRSCDICPVIGRKPQFTFRVCLTATCKPIKTLLFDCFTHSLATHERGEKKTLKYLFNNEILNTTNAFPRKVLSKEKPNNNPDISLKLVKIRLAYV